MNVRLTAVTLLISVMSVFPAAAGDEQQRGAAEKDKTAAQGKQAPTVEQRQRGPDRKPKAPVYVPPLRGAPLARVGGGSRGEGDDMPTVSVITPEHTGYTSNAQPSLYWYLSKKMPARMEVALINDHDIDPILEVGLSEEVDSGINRLSLADFDIELKPGVAYQWSVALVPDPQQRSGDVIASGRVQFAQLTQEQRAQLDNATEEEAVWIFAQAGYWYDAFEQLSRLIGGQPDNQQLRRQRIDLLEQVGLETVAAFDRSQLAATAGEATD